MNSTTSQNISGEPASRMHPQSSPIGSLGKKLLLLGVLAICGLFQSCASPAKPSHLAINSTPDDRSYSGEAKRFERPPPFGSRFNDD